MSNQITTAFVQQYSNNVQMLSQQKGSLLRNTVDSETIVGKNAFFEQVGQAVAQKEQQGTLTLHKSTLHILEEEYRWLITSTLI